MFRRKLLIGASLLPFLVAAGCAVTNPTDPTLQTLATYVTAVSTGIQDGIKDLGSLISASVATKVDNILAEAKSAVTALGGVLTTVGATPSVASILQAAEQFVTLAQSFGAAVPSQVTVILTAINTLLPIIAGFVGMTVPAGAVVKGAAKMTADQAVTALTGVACVIAGQHVTMMHPTAGFTAIDCK